MPSLYIRGLVKVANTARRDLSAPISADRKRELHRLVADSIKEVDRILARNRATLDALPLPTRRAYRFLSGLDMDAVTPVAPSAAAPRHAGRVSFKGLKSFWEQILFGLADPIGGAGPLTASMAGFGRTDAGASGRSAGCGRDGGAGGPHEVPATPFRSLQVALVGERREIGAEIVAENQPERVDRVISG